MLHNWSLLVNRQYELETLWGLKSRLQFLIQHMRGWLPYRSTVRTLKNRSVWLIKQDARSYRYNLEPRKGQRSRSNSRIPIPTRRLRQICGIRFPFLLGRQILPRGIDAAGARGICRGLKPVFPFVFSFFDIYYHCTQFSYAFTAVTSFLFF